MDTPKSESGTEFSNDGELVALLIAHQARIYAFILSLLPNRADAEDILQETCLVLHRRFAEYQIGSGFYGWACQIAFHKVLDFRKRQSRSPLYFDTEFVETMALHQLQQNEDLAARQEALHNCVEKLPADDQQLMVRSYQRGVTIAQVAGHLHLSANAVYKRLRRIRGLLLDCIERDLATSGPT